MRKTIQILAILLVVSVGQLFSQETLPPYHSANSYLEYLKVRGYLPQLSLINRPFQRPEVARLLLKIDWDRLAANPKDQQLVKTLYREFAGEMAREKQTDGELGDLLQKALKLLHINLSDLGIQPEQPSFKLGAFGESMLDYSDETGNSLGRFHAHSQVGFYYKNKITFYNNFRIFNRADSDYIGKKFRGMFGFAEQGFLSYNNPWLQAKIGRDFLQIGPGRTGQLLISDNSRPFDMYHVRIGKSVIQFSFWGIALDRRQIPRASADSALGGQSASRFLNGHRISVNIKNKYSFGVSEVVVYGGVNRNFELAFINPFTFYHNITTNGPNNDSNSFVSLDWDLYPIKDWEIYGEFLIDDFQVDKKTPGDLEPNELGFLGGVEWSNPLGLKGGLFGVEYVQVRNRTYNAPVHDWEKYLHRNKVIGYALGNNLERLRLSLAHWVRPDLRVTLIGDLIQQGEGSVKGVFNTDFLNFTVEQGYNEPFPFGVVQRRWQFGAKIFYNPNQWVNISAEINTNSFNNYRHLEGFSHNRTTARISAWVQWDKIVKLAKF